MTGRFNDSKRLVEAANSWLREESAVDLKRGYLGIAAPIEDHRHSLGIDHHIPVDHSVERHAGSGSENDVNETSPARQNGSGNRRPGFRMMGKGMLHFLAGEPMRSAGSQLSGLQIDWGGDSPGGPASARRRLSGANPLDGPGDERVNIGGTPEGEQPNGVEVLGENAPQNPALLRLPFNHDSTGFLPVQTSPSIHCREVLNQV